MLTNDPLKAVSHPAQPPTEDSAMQRMKVTQNLEAADVAGSAMPLVGKWAKIAKETKSSQFPHEFNALPKQGAFAKTAESASKMCSSLFKRSAEMLSHIAPPGHQKERKKGKH